MANIARFTVGTSASDPPGFDATVAQLLSFRLENPSALVSRWTLQVFDPAEDGAPGASKGAPLLTLLAAGAQQGSRIDAPDSTSVITCNLPAAAGHSWIVRSLVNGGLDANGQPSDDYVFERLVAIRTDTAQLRKLASGETTQYSPTGVQDAINDLIVAMAGGSQDVDGFLVDDFGSFLLNASGAQLITVMGCQTLFPAPLTTLTENVPVTISGIFSRAGAVSVRVGATTLIPAIVGFAWSCTFTPRTGDIGSTSIVATATDAVNGSIVSAQPVPVTIVSAGVPISGFTALDASKNSWFWDSKTNIPFGAAPNQGIQREFYAKLQVKVQAADSRMVSVEGISTSGPTVASHGNTVDVLVDVGNTGTFALFATLTFTTIGAKNTQTFTLPNGDLTFAVVDHLGAQDADIGGAAGGITGITVTGSVQLPTTPVDTLFILGASGSYSFWCWDPAHVIPGQLVWALSWQGILRQSNRFDQVYTRVHNGYGVSAYGITSQAAADAFCATWVVPRCNGTGRKYVYIELAAGDAESSGSSPTIFTTRTQYLLNSIAAQVPDAIVILQSPIVYNGPALPGGHLMTDYNAVFPALVAANDTGFVDGLDMVRLITDLLDGLHMVPPRQAAAAAVVMAAF